MKQKNTMTHWSYSLFALTLVSASISAHELPVSQSEKALSAQADKSLFSHQTLERCQGPRHQRVSVRYTTPEGIGFNSGYATVEGFFTPKSLPRDAWVPFLDVRGHVFDNGRLAANAGLGFRYIAHSRVFGMNAYYDYRNTHRQHYNQVAAGLESLGRIWDFRINGYLPVGRKQSSFSHPKFVAFEGHSLFIRRNRDFAMKGANAEVGVHVDHFDDAPFYFAAGPYYLTGTGKSTWGGELRAVVDLGHRYLRMEGSVSYDHFFKWVGQAQVSINIPFGRRWKIRKETDQPCSQTATLYTRALQRVDRFEIIPVGRQKITSRAINPTTHQPWVFWFVDNTSSSAGTFADPFPTLLDAQNASLANQGIYVFPGDRTTAGMNSGIVLKNGQIFLGAGVPHSIATTVGRVTVPPLASSSPQITNTAGDAVTLANDNTVSGFNVLVQDGHGLAGDGIANLFASQNTFVASSPNLDGIHLINPSGQVFVSNSSFSGFSDTSGGNNGNGIYVGLDSSTLAFIDVTRSQFNNISDPINGFGGTGIAFNVISGGTLNTAMVSGCNFSNLTNIGAGILFSVDGGTFNTAMVSGCNFNNSTNSAYGILTNVDEGILNTVMVSGCNFSNLTNNAFGIVTNVYGGILNTVMVSGCNFSNLTNNAIGIVTNVYGGILNTVMVSGCNFSNSTNNAIGILTNVYGGTFNTAMVSGCNFSNLTDLSVGIASFNSGTINNFNIRSCSFNNVSSPYGVYSEVDSGVVGNLSISNCVFSNSSWSISAIETEIFGGNTDHLTLSNNIFFGGSNNITGYAASIEVSSGTVCLEFIGNIASPANNPTPYVFQQTGGTFNRTVGSDNTTNIGQFEINGAVGAPGSCSE
jgi:trimeric autotransporter adhesin